MTERIESSGRKTARKPPGAPARTETGDVLEQADSPDLRHFDAGVLIPSEHYCDQPHLVKTDDGSWLCAMTTGSGEEGRPGQHVISLRTPDRGRTWEPPVDVEPPDGPEASYAALLKTPAGRVYVFYNHNADNIRSVIADDPPHAGGRMSRVDSLGYFVFKYSDDHGRSWSSMRHVIPVREMEIDRSNPYGGRIRFFWNTGYAFSRGGSGYVPLHKVGRFGRGLFVRSEGVLLRSGNILTEPDPEKVEWETLPEGDFGLRAPSGSVGQVAEEQSFVPLGGSGLFAVYRTVEGSPGQAYSRDGGRTWTPEAFATYGPGRRRIKHPRAAPCVWRCENGKYLLWHHNNGTRSYNSGETGGNRNIAWLCGGVLKPDGFIHWSEPEIAFYCEPRLRGISYPNLIEEDGAIYCSATQKHVARIMRLDPRVAAMLHRDPDAPAQEVRDHLLLELDEARCAPGSSAPMPALPSLTGAVDHYARRETPRGRRGFSIDLDITLSSPVPGQDIMGTRDASGRGWSLSVAPGGALRFSMSDGFQSAYWDCDGGILQPGRRHGVTVIVDGGPKVISYVIDGRFLDGGAQRPFGFGRFPSIFRAPNGDGILRLAPALPGRLHGLRIYGRHLLTGEAILNHRVRGSG